MKQEKIVRASSILCRHQKSEKRGIIKLLLMLHTTNEISLPDGILETKQTNQSSLECMKKL